MSEGTYFDLEYVPLDTEGMYTSFVSLAATGLLVILGIYYKISQTFLGKMVLIVNTADFIFILMKPYSVIFPPTSGLNCRIVSAISHVALMMSFIWGTFFAHVLYTTIKRFNVACVTPFLKYYTIMSVIFSSALGIGVLFSDYVIFPEGARTCVHRLYVRKFDPSLTFLMLIPTFFLTFLCLMWYVLVAINLKRSIPSLRKIELLPLLMYPAVIIVCYFPCLITNIMITFGTFPSELGGYILMNLFQLHGFLNVLVYGIPLILRVIYPRYSVQRAKTEITSTESALSLRESTMDL